MTRITQAVVMLLFGGAIIRSTVTDTFLRYVKEGLRPFLLGAGILLVTAAIMTIWYDLRAARSRSSDPARGSSEPVHSSSLAAHGASELVHGASEAARGSSEPVHGSSRPAHDEHGHDDGHGHGSHEPRVGWLLLAPVMALLLLSPPALGSFAAGQSGSVGPAAASDYPPLPDGDPVEVGLMDYAGRAVFDGGKSLTGRNVKLRGFITPGPDGKPMLARMVLACCAADGRPIKIGLAGAPIDAPPDAWVDVVGVYSPQVGTDPVNQAQLAYLDVRSWQEIDEPKQPYA
ncbi:TIGR03943 family protein [Actinoplanes sp. NPDC026670]|uniref:TIGR03943 family putative permease subunit n=1 Tax=Actinoplanes sp. NPDC026670 TaxID=3154700 RepID=UPI00340374CE